MQCVVLSLIFCFTLVVGQNPGQLAKIVEAHKQCQPSSGITPLHISGIIEGNIPDDPVVKKHLQCVHERLGIQDGDGNLQMNVISEMVDKLTPPGSNKANVQEIAKKCAVQQATREETAFELAKCLYQAKASMMS